MLGRFSARERAVLLAGGLIAWLRASNTRPLDIMRERGHRAAADQGSPITTPLPEMAGHCGGASSRTRGVMSPSSRSM